MRIGVFDSGLGGLTVVKALQDVMGNAKLYYVADTKNAPYGEKTSTQILQYSLDITAYLIETYQIDALVLACNTATSFAIKELRQKYPELIIIGTEPGVKPAIEQTQTGKIGVLATPATLKGAKYQELVDMLSKDKNVQLYEQSCPGLVEQIEAGNSFTKETRALLENWVLPMRAKNVDTIVLGCTHYPLVGETISKIMLSKVILIDTGVAIAKRLHSLLEERGYSDEGTLDIVIEATGEINSQSIEEILGNMLAIRKISISNR